MGSIPLVLCLNHEEKICVQVKYTLLSVFGLVVMTACQY